MTRGGASKKQAEPERRCLVTGASGPKSGLIRFVLGPDGHSLVPDIAGNLPGRGMWVAADRAVIQRAVDRRLFARAARLPVTAPEGLVHLVETLLAQRMIELVSLARKAGEAVCGYEKVRDWLTKDQAALLLQARDGSERGKTKLRPPPGSGGFSEVLSASELGLAFGREHVIHAALAAGGLATRVVEEAARLAAIRGQIGGEPVGKD